MLPNPGKKENFRKKCQGQKITEKCHRKTSQEIKEKKTMLTQFLCYLTDFFLYKTLALVSPALTSITQVSLTLIPNPSISNHNPIISSPNL